MSELYLGVGRELITPEVGGNLYGYRPDVLSVCVADDLTATAFYFRQDDTDALMISVTVGSVQTELSSGILAEIETRYQIPKDRIMLCATHTHSAPNTTGTYGWGDVDRPYCDKIFIPGILKAVDTAVHNIMPVRIGIGMGTSLAGINRRELRTDNLIYFGQNPWGVFNPRMTVLSFQADDGHIVGNMIHYGAHCTAAGLNHEISRDWAGVMIDALDAQTGSITGFFNGPEGDVGPRLSNGQTVGNMDYVREVGALAAQDAIRIFKQIPAFESVSLSVLSGTVLLPLKKRLPLEEATRIYEQYRDHTVNREGAIKQHCLDVIESYHNGYQDVDNLPLPQTLIRIGSIVFAAFPYELFSEIGMRIDQAHDAHTVLSLSNTNGSMGYFVTEDQLCRGGYEIDMFRYARLQPYRDDADHDLVIGTLENLSKLED